MLAIFFGAKMDTDNAHNSRETGRNARKFFSEPKWRRTARNYPETGRNAREFFFGPKWYGQRAQNTERDSDEFFRSQNGHGLRPHPKLPRPLQNALADNTHTHHKA